MKFKLLDEIGIQYRSLFGIFKTNGKIPVFENVDEFKRYTIQTEINIKKATDELFGLVSKEEKFKHGEEVIRRRCEKVIKKKMNEEIDELRWGMLDEAAHCPDKIVGMKEERMFGTLENVDYFVGLFINEDVARECLDLLVERGMANPQNVTIIDHSGNAMEGEHDKEK